MVKMDRNHPSLPLPEEMKHGKHLYFFFLFIGVGFCELLYIKDIKKMEY